MPRYQQSSFASGEITPALHARTDLEQYIRGLARTENAFVSVYGGVLNRAGTQFLDEVAGAHRLTSFALGEQQGYVLEWGDNILRFFTLGARMIVQPNTTGINSQIGEALGQWNDLSSGTAGIASGSQFRKIGHDVGTLYGDLTFGGDRPAAFDGDISHPAAFCANRLANQGTIGKIWGTAPAERRRLYGVAIYGSSDLGLTGRPQPVEIHVQGADDPNGVWTTVGYWREVDRPGFTFSRIGLNVLAEHNFLAHRVVIIGGASGSDIVAISELEFFDRDFNQNSLALVGGVNSISWARQYITTSTPGVEHVLTFYVADGPVDVQVGVGDIDNLLSRRTCNPGWHLVSFTPGVAGFNLQFLHAAPHQRNVEGIYFLNTNGAGPAPLAIGQPYRIDDLPAMTWTQDANVLTLFRDPNPPIELRRGAGALSWSLTYKRVAPAVDPPSIGVILLQAFGPAARPITHSYVVTFVRENGEESLPSEAINAPTGAATLTTTDYMRITVAQPLPFGVVACNLYKLFGGSYGYMGLFVAQFDDIGQAPKVDQPPPQARDPFAGTDNAPVCGAYWEQRFAAGGSVNAQETVELSKPGLPNNFGRSSPPRDDDAITFTPSGPLVRQIKHMLGGKDLILFCEASILVARRGESALTPKLEGGVQQILARGISRTRPLQIDTVVAFVGAEAQSVRLLDAEYAETEISLLAEHLFTRERTIVDWAYAESPWSLLWLAMSDGTFCTLSLLQQQGVAGWARGSTLGRVESVTTVREFGEDVVYWRVRRFLRGAWRYIIERHRSRKITDIRDAFFVDCGLSLDAAAPIVALGLTDPATVTLSNAGLEVGDLIDFDGTGIATIDDHRVMVLSVAGPVYTLGTDEGLGLSWAGLGPWQGSGVIRKCFTGATGLQHLEGHSVMVLNNGNVEGPYTVAGGAIQFEQPGSRVHVGLSYVSECETLDIAEGAEGYGRRKSVKRVNLLVRDTRGLKVGPPGGFLEAKKPRELEEWGEPTRPYSGTIEQTIEPQWALGGKIVWRQDEPLPFEVLSASPLFDRGGD